MAKIDLLGKQGGPHTLRKCCHHHEKWADSQLKLIHGVRVAAVSVEPLKWCMMRAKGIDLEKDNKERDCT